MPELPEVETVVRLLRPDVVGRTIRRAEVLWPRTVLPGTPRRFMQRTRARKIVRLWRRAKYIVFDLEHEGAAVGVLLCHLRMTGRLHVLATRDEVGPWGRVALELDDARWLEFLDVRKFGRFHWSPHLEAGVPALGPEPLEPAFTAGWLRTALAARRRRIKPLLLDQAFVAGLGNIYVDEALFMAGIHPLTPSHRVSKAKAERLHDAIVTTLEEAIRREGSSFDTFYRTPEGQPGAYQHQFQVSRAYRTTLSPLRGHHPASHGGRARDPCLSAFVNDVPASRRHESRRRRLAPRRGSAVLPSSGQACFG